MRKNQQVKRQDWGFTLIELLVVIGIIGLLLALLLPVISRARQTSQNLKCASALRTLGQLLVLFAADHKGTLPLSGNIAPDPNGTGLDDPQTLGDTSRVRYSYYDNGGSNFRVTALPAALAPYISKQEVRDDSWQDVDADIQTPGPLQDAFICPLDQNTLDRTYTAPRWINNYAGGNFQGTFLNGWSSYGINGEVFGWTDAGINGTAGHSRARGKLAIIPHPSDTMLMCDTNAAIEIWVLGPQLSLGDVYMLPLPQSAGSTVFDLVRHRGRMNILYVDGHVDSQPILSTGATAPKGAIGSTGNSPSSALMNVSLDKDFR